MGEQGKGNGSMNSLQRVKVYQLKNDGKWDDKGTGHVTVDYLERSEDIGLIVVDEEDHVTLISHRISSDEIYKKQEDTIISWRDPEFLTEVALSFQEPTGCSYIWDGICGVQRNLHFNTLSNLEGGPRPTMAALDSVGGSHSNDESFHAVNNELRELPSLELSTLPLILKTLLECGMTDQLRVADLILQDQEFFPKLVDLFRMCEESKDMDGLHMIFRLVKAIILLNSLQIFDRIFGDEFILDIIGSLEYDPELAQMQNHRSFLKEHVIFKEAIPIKDPLVLSKIHQTYRIGYIKDVILPRVLDEATIASLSAIVLTNNAAVVSSLKDDSSFIQELFAKMKSPSISAESKRNLVLFLHEFCSLSKSLQGGQQLRLFRELAGDGVFDIIANLLQSEDRKLVLIGTDILILFLHVDSNLLRSYVIQPEGIGFLGLLVKGLVSDFGEEMHCQFLEILRILLDSNTLPGPQRDTIIDIFYEKHLDQLIDVITSSCPSKSISDKNSKSTYSRRPNIRAVTKPEILLNICELLCFCVLHHPYRIKCNFLMNNIIEKVLFLTFRRERFLAVATVRFMRAIVSRNDDHLLRHIAKNNLLKPIIDAFIENGSRYNMLHSGVLELLEFIRKENIKILILYVVDTFWGQLLKFEHLGPIQGLRLKYEQSLENCDIKNSAIVTDPRKRTEERALEKEEEDYFNEDSDEEDSTSAHSSRTWDEQTHPSLPNGTKASYSSFRSASGGLVDYEDDDDDDDDDDYNPPRKTEASTGDDRESSKSKRKSTSKADHDDGDFVVTKKRRLDQDLKDSKIVAPPVHSLCTDIDFPNQKGQLCDATPQTTESNYSLDENGGEEENAGPQSCNKSLPEVADNRQSSGDDCPSEPPIDNSSSDVVANGANSEPYSVR